MEHTGPLGDLELRRSRAGRAVIRGTFPYGERAVLTDGGLHGKPKKEEFLAGCFRYRLERPDEQIHLLVGHDYDKPLASRAAGTLTFHDTREALEFEAEIPPEAEKVSWVADVLAGLPADLFGGISVGFRIPPARANPNAQRFETEPNDPARGMHAAQIRTIVDCLLYEVSIVTSPVYKTSRVELREEILRDPAAFNPAHLTRWRL